jgi:hypothetical protein
MEKVWLDAQPMFVLLLKIKLYVLIVEIVEVY